MANRNIENILGEVFVPGAAPSTPVEGQVYYDSTAHALQVRGVSTWSSATGVTPSMGAFGSTPNANGGTIAAGVLTLQPASAAFPGGITAAQFTKLANLSGTNTGDVTLTTIGTSPNANGATVTGQIVNLQPASDGFGGVVTTTAQNFSGLKSFVSGVSGTSSGAGGIGGAFTGGANGYGVKGYIAGYASGTNIGVYGQVLWGMGTDIGIGVRGEAHNYGVEGIGSDGAGVYGHSTNGSGGRFDSGVLRGAINITPSASIPSSPLEGDTYYNLANHMLRFWNNTTWVDCGSTGGGTGVTVIGAFGAASCAEGGSIAGNTLTLQPASASFPGGLLATAQTLYGEKTFAATGTGHPGVIGTAIGEGTSYGVQGTSTYSYGGYFSSTSGSGIYGSGNTGVVGSGVALGGSFTASAGAGVYSSGTTYGIEGVSTAANSLAVYGHSSVTGSVGVGGCGMSKGVYGGPGPTGNMPVTGVYGEGSTSAVEGVSTATALWGHGGTIGVYGSGSSHGVEGASGAGYGGYFTSTGGSSVGMYATGPTYGVQGFSGAGSAVYGSGAGVGVQGVSTGGSGYGVLGRGSAVGVKGESDSGDYGVHAQNTNTASGNHYGVYADCSSTGTGYRVGVLGGGVSHGIYGSSTTGIGVYAESSSGPGIKAVGNATYAPLLLAGLASAPSNSTAGQIYFNTATLHFYGHNGTGWVQLDN